MTAQVLVIMPSGDAKCLYAEVFRLQDLGAITISRGSFVEPTDNGDWTADLSPVGGPLLGPFERRSDALLAEVEWLEMHYLSGNAT